MSTSKLEAYRREFSVKVRAAGKSKTSGKIVVTGKNFSDYMRNYRRAIKENPEIAGEGLRSAGIIDKNGNLTAPYR